MPKFTSATAPRPKVGEPRKPRQPKEELPVSARLSPFRNFVGRTS